MSSQNIPTDSESISLRRWRVMEVESPDGAITLHVCGHDVTNHLGRSSSPVLEFNMDTMTATTRSGKRYVLVGLPGNSKLGNGAWKKWCRDNGVVSERDVTDSYLNINQISTIGFEKITNSAKQ